MPCVCAVPYRFITHVDLCNHHHNQNLELLYRDWAVIKLLTLQWASSEPLQELVGCLTSLRWGWEPELPIWSPLTLCDGALFPAIMNKSPSSLLSQFWHKPGEKSGLLHYSLAKGKISTLHLPFAGTSWGRITIFFFPEVQLE